MPDYIVVSLSMKAEIKNPTLGSGFNPWNPMPRSRGNIDAVITQPMQEEVINIDFSDSGELNKDTWIGKGHFQCCGYGALPLVTNF